MALVSGSSLLDMGLLPVLPIGLLVSLRVLRVVHVTPNTINVVQ